MDNYFLDIQYIWIVKHFRHTDRSLELLREAAKNVISLVARPLRPSPKTHERTDFGIRKKNDIGNGSLLCVQEVVTPIYIISYYINWGNYFLDTRYFLDRQYEVWQLFCIVN